MVKVDLSGAQSFFDGAGPDFNAAAQAHRTLSEKTGPGNDFIGWPELPENIKNGELKRMAVELIDANSKWPARLKVNYYSALQKSFDDTMKDAEKALEDPKVQKELEKVFKK